MRALVIAPFTDLDGGDVRRAPGETITLDRERFERLRQAGLVQPAPRTRVNSKKKSTGR